MFVKFLYHFFFISALKITTSASLTRRNIGVDCQRSVKILNGSLVVNYTQVKQLKLLLAGKTEQIVADSNFFSHCHLARFISKTNPNF